MRSPWALTAAVLLLVQTLGSGAGAHAQSADVLTLQATPTGLSSPTTRLFAAPSGTLFAVLAAGGVQRSDDGGQTWRAEALPPLDDWGKLALVTLDSSGQAVAFAALQTTRVTDGAFQVQVPALSRGRPGDAAWSPIRAPVDGASVAMASPADPGSLFAQQIARGSYRAWLSRDSGTTWNVLDDVQQYGTCTRAFRFHPTDPLRAFRLDLSCYTGTGGGAPSIPSSLYESPDQGATWPRVLNGQDIKETNRLEDWSGGSDPNLNALAVAASYYQLKGAVVYRSLDRGQSWARLLDLRASFGGNVSGLESPRADHILMDPTRPDLVLVNADRVTDDGGKTWGGGADLGTNQAVMTSSGWFAATSSGVVRLRALRQPVSVADGWQVIATNLPYAAAVSVAPDGSIVVGHAGGVHWLAADGSPIQDYSLPRAVPLSITGVMIDDQGQIMFRSALKDIVTVDGAGNVATTLEAPDAALYGGGLASDGSGNLWVSTRQGAALLSLTDGSQLAEWGTYGRGPGQFGFVTTGIAVDADGNVYLSDPGNNRVQELAPDGTPLMEWDGLRGPGGLALDPAGNLYVAESMANRIVELAPDGTQLATWGGTWGTGLGQLWQPHAVAVDPTSGVLYVADTFNNRLVRITPSRS